MLGVEDPDTWSAEVNTAYVMLIFGPCRLGSRGSLSNFVHGGREVASEQTLP